MLFGAKGRDYDGLNVLEEVDTNGTLVARYTGSDAIDERLAQVRSGTTTYYQTDGLGSVNSLTDPSGSVAATYTYDSFDGLSASTGSVTNPFRYTSREFDGETGQYFYRARYYDTQAGRFTSEDPMRFGAGVNVYAYVLNSPVSLVDPLGLCPQGTHDARRNEILKILAAAQDIAAQRSSYEDIRCNQFVDRAINKPFPRALSCTGRVVGIVM